MQDVVMLQEVDSTNRVARELAEAGCPHGVAVLAEKQTAGRGRLGRTWQSRPGKGLCVTIVLRPELELHDYSKIPLIAGVAVSLALNEICGLEVQLKWPNDIYLVGRKCGGILVETSSLLEGSHRCHALVGIGLNVNDDSTSIAPELRESATSLFIETGCEHDIFPIVTVIRERLLELVSRCVREGFSEMWKQWQKQDMTYGKWMNWVTPAGQVVYGKSLGIDHNGIYLIEDRAGKRHEVASGDLRLAGRSPD